MHKSWPAQCPVQACRLLASPQLADLQQRVEADAASWMPPTPSLPRRALQTHRGQHQLSAEGLLASRVGRLEMQLLCWLSALCV